MEKGRIKEKEIYYYYDYYYYNYCSVRAVRGRERESYFEG